MPRRLLCPPANARRAEKHGSEDYLLIRFMRCGRNIPVRAARTLLTLAATSAWLFCILHCHMQAAGFIAKDLSSAHFESEHSKSDSDLPSDPCETGCKVLEKAPVKVDSEKIKAAVFVALLWSAENLSVQSNGLPHTLPTPQPDTFDISLFVACTSLPARAPSLLS